MKRDICLKSMKRPNLMAVLSISINWKHFTNGTIAWWSTYLHCACCLLHLYYLHVFPQHFEIFNKVGTTYCNAKRRWFYYEDMTFRRVEDVTQFWRWLKSSQKLRLLNELMVRPSEMTWRNVEMLPVKLEYDEIKTNSHRDAKGREEDILYLLCSSSKIFMSLSGLAL